MPFIAVRQDTGERVYLNKFDNPREALAGVEFECQDCATPMIIRMGDIVRAHFAHKLGYEDRPCWFRSAGETEAHLSAKQSIAAALMRSEWFTGARVELEYRIETAAGRRYIDVYMELPDGRRFAHEAQLANQSIAQFTQRTQDYKDAGLIPVWWLGQSVDSIENRSWCENHCDYVGRITIENYRPVLINERYADDGRIVNSYDTGRGKAASPLR